MKEQRKCCGCNKVFEVEVVPGPPEPPPYSCEKKECEEERIKRIRNIVG